MFSAVVKHVPHLHAGRRGRYVTYIFLYYYFISTRIRYECLGIIIANEALFVVFLFFFVINLRCSAMIVLVFCQTKPSVIIANFQKTRMGIYPDAQ